MQLMGQAAFPQSTASQSSETKRVKALTDTTTRKLTLHIRISTIIIRTQVMFPHLRTNRLCIS